MAEFPDERQLVLEVRSQLERWTNGARTEAYTELFEGDDPILTAEERQLLDAIDSAMERQGAMVSGGLTSMAFTRRGPQARIPRLE